MWYLWKIDANKLEVIVDADKSYAIFGDEHDFTLTILPISPYITGNYGIGRCECMDGELLS